MQYRFSLAWFKHILLSRFNIQHTNKYISTNLRTGTKSKCLSSSSPISLVLRRGFPVNISFENLDPFYKTDLYFSDWFRKAKPHLMAEYCWTILDNLGHHREKERTPSSSQINIEKESNICVQCR